MLARVLRFPALPAGTRLLIAAALAAPVAAHDFWIQPDSFRPEPGALVQVQLLVGEHGVGEPVWRNDKRIVRFVLAGPGGETPVAGRDGGLPAGLVSLLEPSVPGARDVFVIGYHSNHARIELAPEAFEEYLRLEGLEHILALREQRGESELQAREAYSRYAKSLVCVLPGRSEDGSGGAPTEREEAPLATAQVDRILGFPLELVAEGDPFLFAGSEPSAEAARPPLPLLRVRLLFEGQPLAGALVRATPLPCAPVPVETPMAVDASTHEPLLDRTGADGCVTLPIPRRGAWLLTSVHMRPAPAAVAAEYAAEWESFWATLTLEVP